MILFILLMEMGVLMMLVVVSYFMSYYSVISVEESKIGVFECGFDVFSLVRVPFSVHFFKLCLIFIYFDVEVVIILPLPMIMYKNMFFVGLFFFMLLVIFLGVLYEWFQGGLDWV